jgi:hypothetical protein
VLSRRWVEAGYATAYLDLNDLTGHLQIAPIPAEKSRGSAGLGRNALSEPGVCLKPDVD